MGHRYWYDGECAWCGTHTWISCDECSQWICREGHMTMVHVDMRAKLYLCPNCSKKMKVGTKVAGVKITKKMMEGCHSCDDG